MTNPLRAARNTDTMPDPTRKNAFASGVFYILTFLTSIPAVFLLTPILNDPNYVTGPGADTRIGFAAILDLICAITGVASAVAVYSVMKRQGQGLALGFVTTRLMEATMIAIGVVSLLAVVTLRAQGFPAEDAGAAVVVDRTLVAARNWTFILGPNLMAALNALMFATLLYRGRFVPRAIPALGLIGAPLMISFAIAALLGFSENGSAFQNIAGAPFFIWELSAGIWMTVKGFNRNAPVVAAAIAQAADTNPTRKPVASTALAAEAGAA
jgi:hypothetical protein